MISVVCVVIVVGGVFAYVFPIIRDRYFPSSGTIQTPTPSTEGAGTGSSNPGLTNGTGTSESSDVAPSDNTASTADTTVRPENSPDVPPGDDTVGTATIDVNSRDGQPGSALANVTNDQCQNACKAYANDLSLVEYCQQVCGLSPIRSVTSSDCSKKTGIQKDYCYKDLAVTGRKITTCDKIVDANISKTCSTRVTQDIIEGQ